MRNGGRRERDDAGIGTLEYVGIVVLAAILTVGLVSATDEGERIRVQVAHEICEITTVGGGGCPDPAATADGEGNQSRVAPLVSPQEQAEAGDYVALGDSFSSGEGADDYIDDTNSDDATKESLNDGWVDLWPGEPHNNICRRSANAYSATVYEGGDFNGDYIFGACSGGIISDYYNDNHDDNDGEGPQRDHITEDTSLITVTMGGNDFGFSDVLQSCIIGGCGPEDTAATQERIDDYVDDLVTLYQDMEDDAPDQARILVVGYPQLFPDYEDITNGGDSFISPEEQAWINEMGDYANERIQDAIEQSGTDVEYVDVTDALEGHEIGTDDPWINDLDHGVDGGGMGWLVQVSRNSFHPKEAGHDAIAEIIRRHIEKGP